MNAVMPFLSGLGRVFSSYGLAIVILLLLFVLTAFGTWEQHYKSIYDVQREYFESLVVVPSFFPLPLPGAYLLLGLLGVNLVVGGLVRIRKRVGTIGVMIAHLGILSLLVAGFVEYQFSTKGSMALYAGDVKGEYESYFDWDVRVTELLEDDRGRVHVIPQERFRGLDAGEHATFVSEGLPFDVRVHGYQRNARPVRSRTDAGVDGFVLKALEPANPAERNLPGLYVTLLQDGQVAHRGLLWGGALAPFVVDQDGRTFGLSIERRTWELPFEVQLERFVKEEHPGTKMAREFSSYVQRVEDGVVQDVHITMNEPMRHRGYTFYQASFIEDGRRGETATVLAVVDNPADAVPEVAVWVILAGLLLHFGMKLLEYGEGEKKRRERDAAA